MFNLCDWEDGRSHLSVPLTRSHLNIWGDLGTFGKIWEDGKVIFFMKINLSNLPEERHAGFNNWLRVFVATVVTC